MEFNPKILAGAVIVAMSALTIQSANAHPSFANGGTVNTKCGLETGFVDRLSTDTNPGIRTSLLNQDGLAPGTSATGNAKAVNPAGTTYNGSITALVGAVNPKLAANGATCGPGANAIIDGIKIGHGSFQVEQEKFNMTNGDKRAFNITQVDANNDATTTRYYGRIIATDILMPSGQDVAGTQDPECAPASLSSNGAGENLNPGGWPGATAAKSKWFTRMSSGPVMVARYCAAQQLLRC